MSYFRALDGVLVVSVEQAVAAPYCTSRLADAGARVVKIERADGDFARRYDTAAAGESAYFVWLNRGKESACLDLKSAEDAELMERMIARADVFVQNLSPGAMQRLGFGSEALRERHPRLITVDVSGYGEGGAFETMKAYDLLVQCESGLAEITGSPHAPGRVGVSVCDVACGMTAYSAVLQALLARANTGLGAALKVSLFDAIADWMAVPLLQFEGGLEPRRVGLNHPTIAPYGAYRCASDELVVFSVQNPAEWQRFCRWVMQDESLASADGFASNEDRVAHREQLDEVIHRVLGSLTRTEVSARLERADIAYAAVRDLAGLAEHAALRRQRQPVFDGAVQMVAPPVRVAEEPGPDLAGIPAVGEHTAQLREEFA